MTPIAGRTNCASPTSFRQLRRYVRSSSPPSLVGTREGGPPSGSGERRLDVATYCAFSPSVRMFAFAAVAAAAVQHRQHRVRPQGGALLHCCGNGWSAAASLAGIQILLPPAKRPSARRTSRRSDGRAHARLAQRRRACHRDGGGQAATSAGSRSIPARGLRRAFAAAFDCLCIVAFLRYFPILTH